MHQGIEKKNSIVKKYPMFNEASDNIFKTASCLRMNMTTAEQLLWDKLRNKQIEGYKFRRQHPYGKYILDFYCNKSRLVIELDGKYHLDKEQKVYDDERTKNLESDGLKVIRFNNEQVLYNIESVVNEIKKILVCG